MYTKGQVSICKVERDIKKESSFLEQIRGACWGRENGYWEATVSATESMKTVGYLFLNWNQVKNLYTNKQN